MNSSISLILSIFLILLAIGLITGAIVAYARQRAKLNAAHTAEGIVVMLEQRSVTPGNPGAYYPVVEFTAASGQTIRFESNFGSRPAGQRVGQIVSVRYDPANPYKAEIDSGLSRLLIPGILFGMGGIACCLGGLFAVMGALLY